MAEKFLVDTDVLIDYLRGHPAAIALMEENADSIVLSAMTVAEVYAGVRGDTDGAEQVALAQLLGLFPVIPLDMDIARSGGLYRRDYGRSHGVGLADAVIAATAVFSGASLKTLNVRHYPMFDNLQPAYRKQASRDRESQ